MGVGRFAYSPILPLMERDAGLTLTMAGVLASANLFGYLVGALLGMTPFARRHRLTMVRWGVASVILTTALMLSSPEFWVALRFITGVSSGFVLIFASSILLDRAAMEGRPAWPPLFFSGIGVGIAFTGLATPPLSWIGGSRASWLGLAIISAGVIAASLRWFTDTAATAQSKSRTISTIQAHVIVEARRRGAFAWLLALYALEAFAYIIPATFLVAMATAIPEIARFAALSWIVVGIAAALSTGPWTVLASRIGQARALAVALTLQAIGVAAPAVLPNAVGVTLAAVALGGTFIAITGYCTGLARDMFPERTSMSISRMTVLYSIGQMIGPIVATAFVLRTGSYAPALLCGALSAMFAAGIAFLRLRPAHTAGIGLGA